MRAHAWWGASTALAALAALACGSSGASDGPTADAGLGDGGGATVDGAASDGGSGFQGPTDDGGGPLSCQASSVDFDAGGAITHPFARKLEVQALSADDTDVYWTDANGLYRCPLGGCAVPTALLAPDPGLVGPPVVVLADRVVFLLRATFSNDTQIVTCPKTGCGASPTTIASVTDPFAKLAADESGVYWTEETTADRAIEFCPLSGCTAPTKVWSDGDLGKELYLDTSFLYWRVGGTAAAGSPPFGDLLACSRSSGCGAAPTVIATNVDAVAVDASGIAWQGVCGQFFRCPAGGCPSPTALTPLGIAYGPEVMASDGTQLVWIDRGQDTGFVGHCAIGACTPAPLAIAPSFGLSFGGDLTAMALAPQAVVWIDRDGNIAQTAR